MLCGLCEFWCLVLISRWVGVGCFGYSDLVVLVFVVIWFFWVGLVGLWCYSGVLGKNWRFGCFVA